MKILEPKSANAAKGKTKQETEVLPGRQQPRGGSVVFDDGNIAVKIK